jgi:hypothetical protein
MLGAMTGAPLIVGAQLIRIAAFALQLAHVLDGRTSAVALLAGGSIVVEMLGFLDLSYRTTGAARIVARSIAVVPILAALVFGAIDRDALAPGAAAWAYAIFACSVVAALWLAAPRHHVLAAAAAALVVLTDVVPRLQVDIIYRIVHATGSLGIGVLVFGPSVLVGVLALLVGRTLPVLRIEPARIARTLRRSPIMLAPFVVGAVVALAGAPVNAIEWLGVLGNLLAAVTGYRMRTRSRAAFVPCIVAVIALVADIAAAPHDRGEVAVVVAAAMFAAPCALVAVHARIRYAIAIAALAVVAMFAAWNAGAVTSAASTVQLCHVLIGTTGVIACIIATFALRAAARVVAATTPEPTVAEVFA